MFLFVRFQREREMGTRTGALMLTNAARDRCTALWDILVIRKLENMYNAFMGVTLSQKNTSGRICWPTAPQTIFIKKCESNLTFPYSKIPKNIDLLVSFKNYIFT